jgi:hypothetical protein
LGIARLVALAERAIVAAVAEALEAGATTVGVRVELGQLPRPDGADLEAKPCWSGWTAAGRASPCDCATATGRSPAAA